MNSARTLRLTPIALVVGAMVMVSGCNSSKTASTATTADSLLPLIRRHRSTQLLR